MANLNAWQRIDRVISGKPWGDGATGSATISADPNTRATITGTATQTTGTAGSSDFANGDLVVLYQTKLTGAGQWEINKVASGGGTTSLTFQVAHHYTYGTGAQIIKVPRYTTATVSAHSVTAWDGTVGGIEVICAQTSVAISGALSANALGFRYGNSGAGVDGYSGEGYSQHNVQNAETGDNGARSGGSAPGAGGGNGTAGYYWGNDQTVLQTGSGLAVGSADLISVFPGGGGSGSTNVNGGAGGGIIMIFTKSFVPSAGVTANAANGVSAPADRGGGGGAGGSILIVCETATLGTHLTALRGEGGAGNGYSNTGGAGGVGRIAIHHSGTITGTTNPTLTDVTDTSLKVSGGVKNILFI